MTSDLNRPMMDFARVVTVTDATNRRLDPGFGQALGIADRHLPGGFKRSSQRFQIGDCDDDTQTGFRPKHPRQDALTLPSQSGASSAAGLISGNCFRSISAQKWGRFQLAGSSDNAGFGAGQRDPGRWFCDRANRWRGTAKRTKLNLLCQPDRRRAGAWYSSSLCRYSVVDGDRGQLTLHLELSSVVHFCLGSLRVKATPAGFEQSSCVTS